MPSKKLHRSGRGNTKPDLPVDNTRHRSYCFTSYDVENHPVFIPAQMTYLLIGNEVCPKTKRKHLQCYVHLRNAKTWTATKKMIGNHIHIEPCKGSVDSNYKYCTKEGDFVEHGTKPQQGKRIDLIEVADQIKEGKTVAELTLENPMLYHQYGRTLNVLEDLRMNNVYRSHMTACTWYYGTTGTGKSERAFKDFSPDTHYVLPKDKGWWDGYRQQHTVIMNDFRGHIPYDELLQIVDRYPYQVSRRGRQPLPFTSHHVIITSSLSPEEVYHNRADNDDIAQLMRRIKLVHCLSRTMEIEIN